METKEKPQQDESASVVYKEYLLEGTHHVPAITTHNERRTSSFGGSCRSQSTYDFGVKV